MNQWKIEKNYIPLVGFESGTFRLWGRRSTAELNFLVVKERKKFQYLKLWSILQEF